MDKNIVSIIEGSTAFRDVLRVVKNDQLPCTVLGVTPHARAFFLDALHASLKKQVVCVTVTEQGARAYADSGGGVLLPDDEPELRSVAAKGRQSEMERIGVLKRSGEQGVVYMSVRSFIRRMMPAENFRAACFEIRAGARYDAEELPTKLADAGYERVGTVYTKGEFARRGEVLDIFPPDAEAPLRVTFFDDEIETIKRFDAETQKSSGKPLAAYLLPPAREIVMDAGARKKMIRYLKAQDASKAKAVEELLFEINEYGAFETADTFLPVMFEPAGVTDYFGGALYVFDDFERIDVEAKRVVQEFRDEFSRLNGEVLDAQAESYLALKTVTKPILGQTMDIATGQSTRIKTVCETDMDLRASTGFSGRMQLLAGSIKQRREHGWSVYLVAGRKAEALRQSLLEYEIEAPVTKALPEGIAISEGTLSYGFEVPSARTIIYGENDIFGRLKKKVAKRRQSVEEDIFSDLSPGDFVVHDIHGKGRYLGLKTMEAGGTIAEYMEIEYRGGDKLYIPTSQIDRVQKYIGSEDAQVQLSRLGGKEWENAKAKTRESALKLAFDLVELYAKRFDNTGFVYSKDTVWQQQFEDAFEYEETDGQVQSLEEIKKDMESGRIMDRLLLGDVGYGKTEVAMRAAFKAVMDSKQVAVLVPTTLLARQHLKTFRARFADFPVTIEGLSRFNKASHKQILTDVARGKVDIVIGTHRILSADVNFNNLGLLVVDEEQRFGVAHKEKIKLLKEGVDVLTLSATPIPRTLEMSLTGVRDLSTIDTPPAMRKQPYSYVMRYSEGLLRDAVMREIERGGQVYFVCRQIKEMDGLLSDLQKNVPEARVAAAHGQMAETELERVVSGFIDGEYDVLVCTTIIESGIDIPRVNTIVVYEADKFGLSQLYQLKGRVGRADSSSYAYFTYLSEQGMNENAAKRLAAIREFTQLGSGYKIAMRDLQIRGAGNLLGPEQSGHMATVGYAMYCKIMRDAVKTAKGEAVEPDFDTSVELNIPAYIPDWYIGGQEDKMDIYRLISRIKTVADAKETSREIADRYGKIPKEVNNLVVSAVLRHYAAAAGIASIIRKENVVELKYAEAEQVNVKKVLKLCDKMGEDAILRASTPPVVVYRLPRGAWAEKLMDFLKQLARCK